MTDLFNEANPDLGNEPQLDPNKKYFEELVGEGKKFKTVEDLAKGKYISDHYVSTLEKRLDDLREDYIKVQEQSNAGPELQALIDQLKSQQLASSNQPLANEVNTNTKASIDPKEIESLVSSQVAKLEATRRETENYNLVLNKVKERYGNSFKDVLKNHASAMGLSDEEVNSMARRNPNLFFKTFDIAEAPQGQNFQAPPSSNVRRDNFAPTTTKRGQSYYDNLRKENPRWYHDPKITLQYDRDLMELGEEFFKL